MFKKHFHLVAIFAIFLAIFTQTTFSLEVIIETEENALFFDSPQKVTFNIKDLSLLDQTEYIGQDGAHSLDMETILSKDLSFCAEDGFVAPFSTRYWPISQHFENGCYINTDSSSEQIGTILKSLTFDMPDTSNGLSIDTWYCTMYMTLDHRFRQYISQNDINIDDFSIFCNNLSLDSRIYDEPQSDAFVVQNSAQNVQNETISTQSTFNPTQSLVYWSSLALHNHRAITESGQNLLVSFKTQNDIKFPSISAEMTNMEEISIIETPQPLGYETPVDIDTGKNFTAFRYTIEIQAEKIGVSYLFLASQIDFTRLSPSDTFNGIDNAVLPIMNKSQTQLVGYVGIARDITDATLIVPNFVIQQEPDEEKSKKKRPKRSQKVSERKSPQTMSSQQTTQIPAEFRPSDGSAKWYGYNIHIIDPSQIGVLTFDLTAQLSSPFSFITTHPVDNEFYQADPFEVGADSPFTIFTNGDSTTWFQNLGWAVNLPDFQIQNEHNDHNDQNNQNQNNQNEKKLDHKFSPLQSVISFDNFHRPLYSLSRPQYSYRYIPAIVHSDSFFDITVNNNQVIGAQHIGVRFSLYEVVLSNYYDLVSKSIDVGYVPRVHIDFYEETMVCDLEPDSPPNAPFDETKCKVVQTPLVLPYDFDVDRYAAAEIIDYSNHLSTSAFYTTQVQPNPHYHWASYFGYNDDENSITPLNGQMRKICPFITPFSQSPADNEARKINAGDAVSYTFYHADPSFHSNLETQKCTFLVHVPALSTTQNLKIRLRMSTITIGESQNFSPPPLLFKIDEMNAQSEGKYDVEQIKERIQRGGSKKGRKSDDKSDQNIPDNISTKNATFTPLQTRPPPSHSDDGFMPYEMYYPQLIRSEKFSFVDALHFANDDSIPTIDFDQFCSRSSTGFRPNWDNSDQFYVIEDGMSHYLYQPEGSYASSNFDKSQTTLACKTYSLDLTGLLFMIQSEDKIEQNFEPNFEQNKNKKRQENRLHKFLSTRDSNQKRVEEYYKTESQFSEFSEFSEFSQSFTPQQSNSNSGGVSVDLGNVALFVGPYVEDVMFRGVQLDTIYPIDNSNEVTIKRPLVEVELHINYLSLSQPIHPFNEQFGEFYCHVMYNDGFGDRDIFAPLIPNPFYDENGVENYDNPPPMGPYRVADAVRTNFYNIPQATDNDATIHPEFSEKIQRTGSIYHAKTVPFAINQTDTNGIYIFCQLPRSRDPLREKCSSLYQNSGSEQVNLMDVCEPAAPVWAQLRYADQVVCDEDDNCATHLGGFINVPFNSRPFGGPLLPAMTIQGANNEQHNVNQSNPESTLQTQQTSPSMIPQSVPNPELGYDRAVINVVFSGQFILTGTVEQYLNTAFHNALSIALPAWAIDYYGTVVGLTDNINVLTRTSPFIVKLQNFLASGLRVSKFYSYDETNSVFREAAHSTLIQFTAVDVESMAMGGFNAFSSFSTNYISKLLDPNGILSTDSGQKLQAAYIRHEFIMRLVTEMNNYFTNNPSTNPELLQFSNGTIKLSETNQFHHNTESWTGFYIHSQRLGFDSREEANLAPTAQVSPWLSPFPWGLSAKISPACFSRKIGTCGGNTAPIGLPDVVCHIECPTFTQYGLHTFLESANQTHPSSVSCTNSLDCAVDSTSSSYTLPSAQCVNNYCQSTSFAHFEPVLPIRGSSSAFEAPPVYCPVSQINTGVDCDEKPVLAGFHTTTTHPPHPGRNNNQVFLTPGAEIGFAWDEYIGRDTNLVSIYVQLGLERYQIVPVVEAKALEATGKWPNLPSQTTAVPSTCPAETCTREPVIRIDILESGSDSVIPLTLPSSDPLAPAALFVPAACMSLQNDGSLVDSCQNGSKCIESTGLCECKPYFSGNLCETFTCSTDYFCNPEGTDTCVVNKTEQSCHCKEGWTGTLCERYIPCNSQTNMDKLRCLNGGVVGMAAGSTAADLKCNLDTCACNGFYIGKSCETCSLQCQNGGIASKACQSCQCPQSTFGQFCQCRGKSGDVTFKTAPQFLIESFSNANARPIVDATTLDSVRFNEWMVSLYESLRHDFQLSVDDVIQVLSFEEVPIYAEDGNTTPIEVNMRVKFIIYYNCDDYADDSDETKLTQLFDRFIKNQKNYFSAIRNSVASNVAKLPTPVDANLGDLRCNIDPLTNFCVLIKRDPVLLPYVVPTDEINTAHGAMGVSGMVGVVVMLALGLIW